MTNDTTPEPWLDVKGIYKYLSLGRSAVYHAIKERGLPAHRTPNNRYVAKPSELDAWVTSRTK
jgi:excisionase family DNA binding protein